MNRRQRRMVGVVIVIGVVVFIGLQIKNRREVGRLAALRAQEAAARAAEEAKQQKELVSYVVPNEAIPKRTTLTDRMVRVVQVEKTVAPWSDEAGRKAYPQSVDQVVGRIALVRLTAQEPIRKERLAAKDDLRAISFIIEPGKRAVTVPMDLIRGVGGFIRQGDFVDILASFPVPGGQTITKAILRRVRILIVDKTYVKAKNPSEEEEQEEPPEGEKQGPAGVPGAPTQAYNALGMVTFEVTPDEAEKLVLASAKLNLTLVLRNPQDPLEEEGDPTVTIDQDIFVDDSALTPNTEPVGEVELILGSAKETRAVGVQ